MSGKNIAVVAFKVAVLGVLLSICFMVGAFVSGMERMQPASPQPPAPDAGKVLLMLLVSSLLQVGVVTFIILRSRWAGWKLVGAIFLAFIGVNTVQACIEAALYLPTQLPPGMVPRLFVMGGFTAATFSPLAVLILGKMRRRPSGDAPNPRLIMPAGEWVWKGLTVGAFYLVVYLTFGYFVAWQNPELRRYYGQTELHSFFATLGGIWSHSPWMFPYHAFRGLLFMAFVLPVIRMMKGARWETSLAVALAFSLLGGAQLLLPNPFMPESIARSHFVEVTSSNFVFGWMVGWLLAGGKFSSGDAAEGVEPAGQSGVSKAA